jgi:hypothetical protein
MRGTLMLDYCTWGQGDYHTVRTYLEKGYSVIPYDRLLYLGKGRALMLEPEVVCSAELVLLVLFLGSSHALPSWHHHPTSQILIKKGQDSETLVLILCRQKKFCNYRSG